MDAASNNLRIASPAATGRRAGNVILLPKRAAEAAAGA